MGRSLKVDGALRAPFGVWRRRDVNGARRSPSTSAVDLLVLPEFAEFMANLPDTADHKSGRPS